MLSAERTESLPICAIVYRHSTTEWRTDGHTDETVKQYRVVYALCMLASD